ncbi:hypothetical protein T492DRAFT_68654 [Pavlovales sp. CCMP2436]|nr:hypothetical protein T492DRAFT_68654 [Pavlovales sp. CCMP2436]
MRSYLAAAGGGDEKAKEGGAVPSERQLTSASAVFAAACASPRLRRHASGLALGARGGGFGACALGWVESCDESMASAASPPRRRLRRACTIGGVSSPLFAAGAGRPPGSAGFRGDAQGGIRGDAQGGFRGDVQGGFRGDAQPGSAVTEDAQPAEQVLEIVSTVRVRLSEVQLNVHLTGVRARPQVLLSARADGGAALRQLRPADGGWAPPLAQGADDYAGALTVAVRALCLNAAVGELEPALEPWEATAHAAKAPGSALRVVRLESGRMLCVNAMPALARTLRRVSRLYGPALTDSSGSGGNGGGGEGRKRSTDGLGFVALEAASAFEVSNEAGEGVSVFFADYADDGAPHNGGGGEGGEGAPRVHWRRVGWGEPPARASADAGLRWRSRAELLQWLATSRELPLRVVFDGGGGGGLGDRRSTNEQHAPGSRGRDGWGHERDDPLYGYGGGVELAAAVAKLDEPALSAYPNPLTHVFHGAAVPVVVEVAERAHSDTMAVTVRSGLSIANETDEPVDVSVSVPAQPQMVGSYGFGLGSQSNNFAGAFDGDGSLSPLSPRANGGRRFGGGGVGVALAFAPWERRLAPGEVAAVPLRLAVARGAVLRVRPAGELTQPPPAPAHKRRGSGYDLRAASAALAAAREWDKPAALGWLLRRALAAAASADGVCWVQTPLVLFTLAARAKEAANARGLRDVTLALRSALVVENLLPVPVGFRLRPLVASNSTGDSWAESAVATGKPERLLAALASPTALMFLLANRSRADDAAGALQKRFGLTYEQTRHLLSLPLESFTREGVRALRENVETALGDATSEATGGNAAMVPSSAWLEGIAPRASSVGVCSDLRSALRVQLKLILEVDPSGQSLPGERAVGAADDLISGDRGGGEGAGERWSGEGAPGELDGADGSLSPPPGVRALRRRQSTAVIVGAGDETAKAGEAHVLAATGRSASASAAAASGSAAAAGGPPVRSSTRDAPPRVGPLTLSPHLRQGGGSALFTPPAADAGASSRRPSFARGATAPAGLGLGVGGVGGFGGGLRRHEFTPEVRCTRGELVPIELSAGLHATLSLKSRDRQPQQLTVYADLWVTSSCHFTLALHAAGERGNPELARVASSGVTTPACLREAALPSGMLCVRVVSVCAAVLQLHIEVLEHQPPPNRAGSRSPLRAAAPRSPQRAAGSASHRQSAVAPVARGEATARGPVGARSGTWTTARPMRRAAATGTARRAATRTAAPTAE